MSDTLKMMVALGVMLLVGFLVVTALRSCTDSWGEYNLKQQRLWCLAADEWLAQHKALSFDQYVDYRKHCK